MGKHFDKRFKEKVVEDYKNGSHGGRKTLARFYNISESTLYHWIEKDRKQGNQINDIDNKRAIVIICLDNFSFMKSTIK